MSARRVRIGIDTGGTFTDVVAVDEDTGQVATTKTPSTPARPGRGLPGRRRQGARADWAGRATRGHRRQPRDDGRDQPAARGQARPDSASSPPRATSRCWRSPASRCPTATATATSGSSRRGSCRPTWCAPSRGRLDHHRRRGARRSTRTTPRAAARFFRDARHHHHRRLLPALLRQRRPRAARCATCSRAEHPDAVVSISSEVLREYREYERSVTTLVDAAVKPQVAAYVANIRAPAATTHRAGRAVLRDEEQRRRAVGRRGRAPADHDRAVRPGRRRARRGADRRARPASTACSPATAAAPRPTSRSSSTASRR